MMNVRLLLLILVIRPVLYLLFGINIVGRENLVGLDNFILYANHNSHLDIFLLFQALPYNKISSTHPLAAYDYFKKPAWLYHVISFLFQPIWVDRNATGHAVIREIQGTLDQKGNIIIFPEGTRGKSSEILDFKHGIGLIAQKNPSVPIVPVYLKGPERAYPSEGTLPIPLCNHITIAPSQSVVGASKEISSELHHHLIALAEEELSLRQRRPVFRKKALSIATIGIDGSGKSTLARQLCHRMPGESCFIGDNIELFRGGVPYSAQPLVTNELRMWIGNKAKKAKNLALYKVPKLTELLLRDRLLSEVEKWYRPEFVLLDGSPVLNMLAWAHLYHDDEFDEDLCLKALGFLTGVEPFDADKRLRRFPELRAIKGLHLNQLHMPDIVLFLDIDPKISIERILSRGEHVQAHENMEKLTRLRAAYHLVCRAISRSHHVCLLNAEVGLEQLCQEALSYIASIDKEGACRELMS